MYEGTWEVKNDDDLRNTHGLLVEAFGYEYHNLLGGHAARKGRVRNFIDRRLFTANNIDTLFPTTQRHNSHSEAHKKEQEKIGY